MPWYRIFADHGPGHQSHTEFYRWYTAPLDTKQKRNDAWEEWFDGGCGQYDWPIGDVELVDSLPQHIYDEKVKSAHDAVQHAKNMLEVLTLTKTKPVIAVRLEIKPPAKPGEKPISGFQARTLGPADFKGLLKPTRDGAVRSLLSKLSITEKGKTRRARKSDYAVISR